MTINHAIAYAIKHHEGQKRKLDQLPYITHPLSVAIHLGFYTEDEQVIMAAILHDVLEDTSATYGELEALFGHRVAELVLMCSERDKSLPWRTRKEKTLKGIPRMTHEARLIIMADKIDNLESIRSCEKENLWTHFNADLHEQRWFYTATLTALAMEKNHPLYDKLTSLVKEIFA